MDTNDGAAATRALRDTAFFGHPVGLGWLSFAELWERFSFYGMQALLVLYMTHTLLQPGHVENVLGFVPFRHAIESVYGAMSPQALASAIFGLYAGLVYVTPIAGGFLADRLTGRTAAVALGASLMALGHFLMAFEASFLIALACLLTGVGCFKGNISTQVGELYGTDDPRRADGFQLFVIAIQLAVIASPLVCGTLGEVYGWHWGFGAAGVGMLIGLAVYLYGRPTLPVEAPRSGRGAAKARPPLGSGGWRSVLILIGLIPVLALASVGNAEIFNAYLVWAEANYQLMFFGRQMPVTWILSFGSVISATMIVLSVSFWRWWARRSREPDEITKTAIGAGIAALAPVLLAIASAGVAATGQKAGIGWAFAFEIITEAVEHALADGGQRVTDIGRPDRPLTLGMLIDAYLSPTHRDHLAASCAVATMAADVARGGDRARAAYSKQVEVYLRLLTDLVSGPNKNIRRARSITALAALVGAVSMARAVKEEKLSREILASTAQELMAMLRA